MVALGLRLLDARAGKYSLAAALGRITAIETGGLDPRLAECVITVATDVTNPLCGDRGATAVYGPQKGAGEAELALLEAGMRSFGALVDETGRPPSQ